MRLGKKADKPEIQMQVLEVDETQTVMTNVV